MKHTGWIVTLSLTLLVAACQPTKEAAVPAAANAVTTQWQCSNDLEISCDATRCDVAESFTPMSVTVDDAGSMSVCAYSGCWEGTGTVTKSERFVVLTGHHLPFSTAPDPTTNRSDIAMIIDKADRVAVLKAGSFAHPLRCESSR